VSAGDDRADPATPAVLLDLDGTLLDTRALWHAAYMRLADELGVAAPEDLWSRVAGRSMRESLDVYGPAVADEDAEALIARLVTLASAAIGSKDRWGWLPGAAELLTTLRPIGGPRPPVALVTSAWRAFTLPHHAAAHGGEDRVMSSFAAIVCGDDITEGKPSPAGHLRAAALLDAAPESCLVVEDSPTGVAAAQAAGMVVLVVPHAAPVTPAPGRAVRATLTGLTLAELSGLHARLRSGATD